MTWYLGSLSERYESGGDPGAVSSGLHDRGGISYGLYQLATKAGTAGDFARNEGRKFDLVGEPGSGVFGAEWRAAARQHTAEFAAAQRAFIRRTHYDPVVRTVGSATGVNLDAKPSAIRDAVWSCSVQHGHATAFLIEAVSSAQMAHGDDRMLLREIYAKRCAYVLAAAKREPDPGQAEQLRSIVRKRYVDELARALAMMDA